MISGPGVSGYPTAGIEGPGTGGSTVASRAGGGGNFSTAALGIGAAGDILTGLFGFFAGQNAQDIYASRARMIRLEAETEALRYEEQVKGFQATQKLAYLKSGVQLTGSPLEVLDETIRVGRENASAIRASGEARALGARMGTKQTGVAGRNALIGGITGGVKRAAVGAYSIYQAKQEAGKVRNNTPTGY